MNEKNSKIDFMAGRVRGLRKDPLNAKVTAVFPQIIVSRF